MRVLFDHQIFVNQMTGGISRYFAQLIRAFDREKDVQAILPFKFASNYHLRTELKHRRVWGFPMGLEFPTRGRIETFIERIASVYPTKRRISKGDFDVLHPTFYDPYFIPLLKRKPYVLTVYDTISEKFLHDKETDPQVVWKPIVIPEASRIIAISHSTKRDVVEQFGVPPDKIDVVHLAGSMDGVKDEPIHSPWRFILYVGARTPYKNFDRFAIAIAPLLNDNLKLYCAGGGRFRPDELDMLLKLGIADKVFQSQATDGQLAYLYRNAALFVFPSLYEGFGIPVLEALSCGCPTAVSDTSSLPEIGGDAVSLFDPTDTESIRQTVKRVLTDPSLEKYLSEGGPSRSHEFSWLRCAGETIEVYRKTLLCEHLCGI